MEYNEIEKLKERASRETGVPVELISGETAEEIAANAAALADYKREKYEAAPAREKFAAWLTGEPIRQEPGPEPTPTKYPKVNDGGEANITLQAPRSTRDQFADSFGRATAFNPAEDTGSW